MKNDSQYFTEMLASATIVNNQQKWEKKDHDLGSAQGKDAFVLLYTKWQ